MTEEAMEARVRDALERGDDATVVAIMDEALGDRQRLELSLLLAEYGRVELALAAAARIADPSYSALARRVLSGDETDAVAEERAEDEHDDDDEDVLARRAARTSDDRTVSLFLEWFGGRRDIYAQQWFDERRRRSGYRPVREPLTPAVARRHLEGRMTIGQYVLWPDESASFGVIDLDLTANALHEWRAERGADAPAHEHPVMRSYTRSLREAAARLGLSLFAFDSGSKGVHLWLFFRPRRPARTARVILSQIVAAAGPQPASVGVELFPKQEKPGPRGLSSLVKLPLGIHQVTLRSARMLDTSGAPIEDPLAALGALSACPDDVVDDVVGRRLIALPSPESGAPEPLPALPSHPTPKTLASALRAIEPGRAERDACERMLSGCEALRGLVDQAYRARNLKPDAARAIAYTLGLVSSVPQTARDTFAVAGASFRELDRLQSGLPSPLGCKKLREITGTRCRGCVAEASPYPSPTLFAVGVKPPGEPEHHRFAEHLDEPLVQSPFDALAAGLQRIEERLDRLERK
jgi:hypothetical protein